MSKDAIFLDSFSGAVADLKPKERTEENVLAVLREHPRVSTWDLSENRWLWTMLARLEKAGKVTSTNEGYPWHRYEVTTQSCKWVEAYDDDSLGWESACNAGRYFAWIDGQEGEPCPHCKNPIHIQEKDSE